MSEALSSRAPLWVNAARPWHPPVPAGLALYEALRLRKSSLSLEESAARPRGAVCRALRKTLPYEALPAASRAAPSARPAALVPHIGHKTIALR